MAETQAETPVELPPRPGPVNHPSLKDTAAAYLREQILTGQLPPGTKIDQDEISEALGISRLPVREALIELAQESLIDAVPRRGAFVARLERADVVDHYRIFGLIAGLAGSRAATSLSDEELAHLRRIHESFVAATDPEDKARWNHEFHRIINQRRRLPPVGVGARPAVAQPPGAVLRVRSHVGRPSPPATTHASSPRSRRTTRTRPSA